MKDEVLHALLVARTLFDTARAYCFVRDRYVASAGLILLQDALELVLYSSLLEIGIDEGTAIESLTFDQLIGELRKKQLPVLKSGTLKAMNKQRVLIKHHAQLAEPTAVQQYYRTCVLAADQLLQSVVHKTLQQVVIADAIRDRTLAAQIHAASEAIDNGRYFDAMIETRKALFLAVEAGYDIRAWADHDPTTVMPLHLFDTKAPQHVKNREFIRHLVTNATDYVQLDHDRVKTEMLQIGIDPEEFFNVWRLTPPVYQDPQFGWSVEWGPEHQAAASEDNARYCLDVVVSIVRNQESRKDIVRVRQYRGWSALILRDCRLMHRATRDQHFAGSVLAEGTRYDAEAVVKGIDGNEEYVRIVQWEPQGPYMNGYILREDCELEEC